jgi:aminoglycoside 6-adenylyltransferase
VDHARVLADVVAWAEGEENVRLVVVTGSLARAPDEAHALSDLDVELYVREPRDLLGRREWYRTFGEVLVVEELENPGWHPTRLVYYVDGKIDFMIGGVTAAEGGVAYGRPYRVVVDKGGLGSRLRLEPEKRRPPDRDAFLRCVNWFWAAALMAAKDIVRDEPWKAKMRDRDLKDELLLMIEWDHRARYGPGFDTWHLGTRMRRWMDADILDALERCWSSFALDETRSALLASVALFDRVATRTAAALGLDRFDATRVRAEVERILGAA